MTCKKSFAYESSRISWSVLICFNDFVIFDKISNNLNVKTTQAMVVFTCQVSKLDTWNMLKMSNPSLFNMIPQNCVVDTHVRANRAFGLPARVSHNMAMFKRQESHLSGINPSRRLTVLTGVCTLSGPSLSLCGPWFWNYLSDSLAPESIGGQGY